MTPDEYTEFMRLANMKPEEMISEEALRYTQLLDMRAKEVVQTVLNKNKKAD